MAEDELGATRAAMLRARTRPVAEQRARATSIPFPSRALVDYDEEDVDDGEKAAEDGKDVKKYVRSRSRRARVRAR